MCLWEVENRIADREGCGSVPCKAASGLRQGGRSCKTARGTQCCPGLHGAEETVGPGASARVQHALSGKAGVRSMSGTCLRWQCWLRVACHKLVFQVNVFKD